MGYLSSLARAQSAQRAQNAQNVQNVQNVRKEKEKELKHKRSLSTDDEKQHKPTMVSTHWHAQPQRRSRVNGHKHSAARQKSHTQHSERHSAQGRAQPRQCSPRSLDDMDAMAIESEIARAYEDTRRVLTMRDLEDLDEAEEDVESLFE